MKPNEPESAAVLKRDLLEALERERLLRLALANLVELDADRRETKRRYRKALHNAVALLHRGNE